MTSEQKSARPQIFIDNDHSVQSDFLFARPREVAFATNIDIAELLQHFERELDVARQETCVFDTYYDTEDRVLLSNLSSVRTRTYEPVTDDYLFDIVFVSWEPHEKVDAKFPLRRHDVYVQSFRGEIRLSNAIVKRHYEACGLKQVLCLEKRRHKYLLMPWTKRTARETSLLKYPFSGNASGYLVAENLGVRVLVDEFTSEAYDHYKNVVEIEFDESCLNFAQNITRNFLFKFGNLVVPKYHNKVENLLG